MCCLLDLQNTQFPYIISKAGTYRYRNMYRQIDVVYYRCNAKVRYIAEHFACSEGSRNGTIELTSVPLNEHSAEHVAFSPGLEHGASRPTNEPLPKKI